MYTPILATLGYIISSDRQQTLLVHRNRRQNDQHLGKYNGLGGKMEPGEDIYQCLVREIYEEAGIVCERRCCGARSTGPVSARTGRTGSASSSGSTPFPVWRKHPILKGIWRGWISPFSTPCRCGRGINFFFPWSSMTIPGPSMGICRTAMRRRFHGSIRGSRNRSQWAERPCFRRFGGNGDGFRNILRRSECMV